MILKGLGCGEKRRLDEMKFLTFTDYFSMGVKRSHRPRKIPLDSYYYIIVEADEK
jgi:hypothetical protein